MNSRDLTIDMVKMGDSASFDRTWTQKDFDDFARISGNENPLHTDDTFAASTKFGKRIAYGMQVAVMASKLVGMQLPGKRAICLKQSFEFKKPIYAGDTTRITGTVAATSATTGIVEMAISVMREEEEIMTGSMTTQILPESKMI